MQNIRAILFDLDGTLINSLEHIIDCWQHTIRTALGYEMPREEIVPTLGRSLFECFEELAPGRSLEMHKIYREHQKKTHDTTVTIVEGTYSILDTLKASGLRLGVVTSKGIVVAMEGLDLFNLAPYFEVLVTHEETERHKPFPDPLLLGCQKLNIEPEQVVYVGDAVFDIVAGKSARMKTVGVTWGAGTLDEIRAAQPDYIATNTEELASIVCARVPVV